jgi:hypothetical protein
MTGLCIITCSTCRSFRATIRLASLANTAAPGPSPSCDHGGPIGLHYVGAGALAAKEPGSDPLRAVLGPFAYQVVDLAHEGAIRSR